MSPNPSCLPVQQGKDSQRGEFLPLVKGGQEGFSFQCLYNYGQTNNICINVEI